MTGFKYSWAYFWFWSNNFQDDLHLQWFWFVEFLLRQLDRKSNFSISNLQINLIIFKLFSDSLSSNFSYYPFPFLPETTFLSFFPSSKKNLQSKNFKGLKLILTSTLSLIFSIGNARASFFLCKPYGDWFFINNILHLKLLYEESDYHINLMKLANQN